MFEGGEWNGGGCATLGHASPAARITDPASCQLSQAVPNFSCGMGIVGGSPYATYDVLFLFHMRKLDTKWAEVVKGTAMESGTISDFFPISAQSDAVVSTATQTVLSGESK